MTDQQNAALEPCPWCGGEADWTQRRYRTGYFVKVRCGKCTAQVEAGTLKLNLEAAKRFAFQIWNTRHAPAGAEAVREALTGCMAALKSARSWFETIAEAPEDEADGFVEEAKNVVDAAYFNADCALDALAALAKAPSTGEGGAEANEIRHLKEQIRQMFITIDKQAAALATPQPAPTAAEDGLRELLRETVPALRYLQDTHWSLEPGKLLQRVEAALRAKPEASKCHGLDHQCPKCGLYCDPGHVCKPEAGEVK